MPLLFFNYRELYVVKLSSKQIQTLQIKNNFCFSVSLEKHFFKYKWFFMLAPQRFPSLWLLYIYTYFCSAFYFDVSQSAVMKNNIFIQNMCSISLLWALGPRASIDVSRELLDENRVHRANRAYFYIAHKCWLNDG